MVDKNKILDEAMRRENKFKTKKVLSYTLLALVLGGIYSFAEFKNYDRVKFSKTLTGVVQSSKSVLVENADKQTLLIIKLQNSKTVEVPQSVIAPIEQGEHVNVLREEFESGRLRYSIAVEE